MTTRQSLMMLFVFCLGGCVPSLHELYTEKTLVYDPAIAGLWQQDEERWEFAGDPEAKSYALTITEKDGKQSNLDVHLVAAGGQQFFDFYPADDAELEGGDWIKFHVIPVHLFFKVERKDNMLTLAAMDPDKMDDLLNDHPDWVRHERVEDGRVVLTDTPENLQKFLLKCLKVEGVFGEPVELTPVK